MSLQSGSAFFLLLIVFLAGCTGQQAPPADLSLSLQKVVDGLDQPVFATTIGDAEELYIVEQTGVIRVLKDGALQPFLDIRDLVGAGGERGLLGLAFAPDFDTSNHLYVHYTDKSGDTVLALYHAKSRTEADPNEATVLLQQDQPYSNHNGGMIAFGPDGHLYMGLGDGGSGGDPHGNGQRLDTILGKILRLDVSGEATTAKCPASNPKLGQDARCEIWAYGMRNPWRFSFDRGTGDLYIGDVGQNGWEEIDHQPESSNGGENYGWNTFEGTHRYRAGDLQNHVPPISEYATGPGGTCAVTGGYVYRGKTLDLEGRYVFGDYCSGTIWMLQRDGDRWTRFELLETDLHISSFGEDKDAELLVIDRGGAVYRLVAS